MSLYDKPHRRLNILTGEWLLISPHRTKRPWQGQVETPDHTSLPEHDPGCYLCPGNTRAGGTTNPDYDSTFVFDNDYAALLPDDGDTPPATSDDLLRAEPETGASRVICYSPRHDLTMARLPRKQIEKVIDVWKEEFSALADRKDIGYIQIFENKGAMMGCSNPHPHGQIWATRALPTIPSSEHKRLESHLADNGSCLICDYLKRELAEKERIVFANDSFVVLVPFWAVWPFETMLLPRDHMADITTLDHKQQADLADALKRLTIRYDNVFQTSFPYSMGIHQQPVDGQEHKGWHFHFHFLPPLLRSQTVRKFMVGYEMLGMPQRDITAEAAARRLRECSETHYRDEE